MRYKVCLNYQIEFGLCQLIVAPDIWMANVAKHNIWTKAKSNYLKLREQVNQRRNGWAKIGAASSFTVFTNVGLTDICYFG